MRIFHQRYRRRIFHRLHDFLEPTVTFEQVRLTRSRSRDPYAIDMRVVVYSCRNLQDLFNLIRDNVLFSSIKRLASSSALITPSIGRSTGLVNSDFNCMVMRQLSSCVYCRHGNICRLAVCKEIERSAVGKLMLIASWKKHNRGSLFYSTL